MIVLAALGVVHSAGWYVLARYAESRAARAIASVNDGSGMRLNCENARAIGYPLGLGLRCDTLLAENAGEGVSLSTAALQARIDLYDPTLLVGEFDSGARLVARGVRPLVFDWRRFLTEVRMATPLPREIRTTLSRLNAYLAGDSGLEALLLSADDLAVSARPEGPALEIAADARGVLPDRSLAGVDGLPPLDAAVDLVVDDGARRITSGTDSLRGASGTLRRARISPGPQGEIVLEGTFSVSGDGLVDANLAISVRGAKALSEIAIRLFPDAAGDISSAAASLEALGENTRLPLRIVAGRASFGFIELGDIPPLP